VAPLHRYIQHVLQVLFFILEEGGRREGWLAEYFLSKMNPIIVIPFLDNIEQKVNKPEILTKIERIKAQGVVTYLTALKKQGCSLGDFAKQVLSQLEIDID